MANPNTQMPQETGHTTEPEPGMHNSANTAGTGPAHHGQQVPNQAGRDSRHQAAHGIEGISNITGKAMEGTAGIVGDSLHGAGLKGPGKLSKNIGKQTGDLTSSLGKDVGDVVKGPHAEPVKASTGEPVQTTDRAA